MKEQNPALQDESIKTDNETCEMCATEKAEPESNTAQEKTGMLLSLQDDSPLPG